MSGDSKFDVTLKDGHRPLAPDEPVFCFRAQDQTLPAVLTFYADLCEAMGSPDEHVILINDFRDEVLRWQEKNGCSVPD